MKHTQHNPGVRAAAVLSLGLALAAGPAFGDTYELAAGASETLTSETAETTTYDSMLIAGSLTVSGKKTVQSTGKVTVDGGTVTVSGNGASIGKQGSSGCDWDLGADGKVVIDGGKSDFAVGAKVFTILDSCAGQDGCIDFMEINGGGFRPFYLDNNAAATARIKVSGTATLKKGSGNSYGRGLVRKGAFEFLLQNGANLTFDVDNQQGSLNGGRDASENSVDLVGAGDVTFRMRWNAYPYSLRAGAKLNHTGSVTFLSGNASAATFALEGDDLFGANITNVCVAATAGNITLDIAAGTTQTVRRLSFLRAGMDDVIKGAGTLRINAVDADAVFEARLADDAALTIEKTGAQPVTAPCITNYPALKVLAGSYTITNDCTIGALTLAEGATLVVDGAAVHADAFDNAGGAVSYLHGGTLDFRRTVADGETEEVRNWTMNGGTGFVKDGAGTLHLYDPAVTGLVHVAEGTLSFSRHGLLDKFFHIVFKEQCAYNYQGRVGTLKLQTWSWYAPNAATLISSPEYGTLHYSLAGEDVTPSALTDGQVTYRAHGSGTTFEDDSNKNAHYIFLNGGGSGNNKKCFFACSLTNAADSANWQHLWVRLPDKNSYANGVDGINCLVAWGGGNLTAWTVESSATGDDGTWRTVSDVTGYVPAINSSSYASGDTAKPMALLSYTQTGVRNLADTLAVQVDSGATLDFTAKTGGQMIDRIVFDASAGGGTIRNVAVAATGVLEIVNAEGVPKYGYALPLVFDGVSGTENFANWTVTVNGEAVERELVFRGGALTFGNPATVFSVH